MPDVFICCSGTTFKDLFPDSKQCWPISGPHGPHGFHMGQMRAGVLTFYHTRQIFLPGLYLVLFLMLNNNI